MCWLGLREGISTVTPGSFAMLCLLGTELQNILSFFNAQEGIFGCFVIHLTFSWLKINLWLSAHIIWIKVGKPAWLLAPLVHNENLCINVVRCCICSHGSLYLIFYLYVSRIWPNCIKFNNELPNISLKRRDSFHLSKDKIIFIWGIIDLERKFSLSFQYKDDECILI